MNLLKALKKLDFTQHTIALVSTSKKQNESRLLPFHHLLNNDVLNMLVDDAYTAKEVFSYLDGHLQFIFVDIERKKLFNLWDIATSIVLKATILPYKPNDVTRESAYYYINQHFNYRLKHKKIIIYGCGNIGTKLALYLAEHEARVSLMGRNKVKLSLLKDALNSILPTYNDTSIALLSAHETHDALITALSGNHVVNENFLHYLKDGALVVDIGIGNLSVEFIAKACMRGIKIYRLDVRMGTPFLAALLQSHNASFMTTHVGSANLHGISCVAGGYIGKEGDIVLDKITNAESVVGIADGTGGIKKQEHYTKADAQTLKNFYALKSMPIANEDIL